MKIINGEKLFKKIKFSILPALILAAAFAFTAPVLAAAPSLTLTANSDGDSVTVNVSGDANKNVIFYYNKSGSGLQLSYLGTTNSSGLFNTNLSTVAYGISAGGLVHVMVNGINSPDVAWPNISASNVLALNPTSLVLSLGQETTVTAYNNGTNLIYLSNNSNPPVANVNISGNQLTIKALNYGSTVITVCAQANSPSCASTYLIVQNTGAKTIAFSQNNATVASGQNTTVKIIGGTGNYVILNNSNSGIIQSSLSGSTVTLTTGASSGSSAITVCSSDMSSCGIINAAVGGTPSSGLTFSQTNPTMTINQNLDLSISGGLGGYSLSDNTDTTVVQASVSGNNLKLTANAGGTSTVTVCSSTGNCAALLVTVNFDTTTSGGNLKLSQNNLWLNAGQSASVTISGGHVPYSASGYSENILKATITNNTLNISAVSAGSASVDVCSNGGGCISLSVLVSGVSSSASLSLSQSKLALTAGSTATVAISGNGNYFVAYNTNSSVASVSISGNNANVNALTAGKADVSICQNGGQCVVLSVTVSSASSATPTTTEEWIDCAGEKQICAFSGSKTVRYGAGGKYYYGTLADGVNCVNAVFGDPIENVVKRCAYGGLIPAGATIISPAATPATPATPTTPTAAKFKFTKTLVYGAKGNEVKELQQRLKDEGFYSGAIDGRYLTSTVLAVKKYQKAKGIKQTGNLGVLTMGALNK